MTGQKISKNASDDLAAHRVLALLLGAAVGQSVAVAAELGIADLLADGQKTAEQLAGATGANIRALTNVMRALTSAGVFQEMQTGVYSINEMGELLRSDSPDTLGMYAISSNREHYHKMWSKLSHSVKTGQSAFEEAFGMSGYDFYGQHPEEAALFHQALTGQTHREAMAIRDAYDFSRFGTVIDIGGGRGYLLRIVLEANPHLFGTLFDMNMVVEGVAEEFATAGFAERSAVVAGDFLGAVPEGGDLYIFKRVFIDRNDEQAKTILRNCRIAIAPNGRVLIADPDIESRYGKIFDVFMLAIFGTGIRNQQEWESLFDETGFRLTRTINTASTVVLLEAEAI